MTLAASSSTRGDVASAPAPPRPCDVGIIAMEVYFPRTFVSQVELERFDGVSAGKYTIGLGQDQMAVVSDREDIHSVCLTVTKQLLDRHQVDPRTVGRLEVGTETILDKSKSVKSVLMQLFEESGNSDIEGLDTTNACYGGTNALLNTINWVESCAWDGRYGIVVAGDIAVYAKGNARATGGAGAVAMLIGPNAPIVFESTLRASHMAHSYDFYKPILDSEYPIVDGPFSAQCYLTALDQTYRLFKKKELAQNGKEFDLSCADFVVFHSPFARLVQKSLSRLFFNDFASDPTNEKFKQVSPLLTEFLGLSPSESVQSRPLQKQSDCASESFFTAKTLPSLDISKRIGNSYTASLYISLASLLISVPTEELAGKRALLFSYGSGLASTLFPVRFRSHIAPLAESLAQSVRPRLDDESHRIQLEPEQFDSLMAQRAQSHNCAPFTPSADLSLLSPGTYYLTHIDDKWRRFYAVVPPEEDVLASESQ